MFNVHIYPEEHGRTSGGHYEHDYGSIKLLDIASISTRLHRGNDGIWYAGQETVSYPEGGHDECFKLEDQSFWFRHRNECIVTLVKKYPPRSDSVIFDIGGGNGCVAAAIARQGFNVVLVEPGAVGAHNARLRGLTNIICASFDAAQFHNNSLPAVGLFDVLEHIEGDLAFLEKLRSVLEPGGRLYATVPAHSYLWSYEDCASGHFRRYTRAGLESLLQAAGFEVAYSSYFFGWLPVPIFLMRSLPFRLGLGRRGESSEQLSRNHGAGNAFLARFTRRLLGGEVKNIARGRSMAFGSSCIISATRS